MYLVDFVVWMTQQQRYLGQLRPLETWPALTGLETQRRCGLLMPWPLPYLDHYLWESRPLTLKSTGSSHSGHSCTLQAESSETAHNMNTKLQVYMKSS